MCSQASNREASDTKKCSYGITRFVWSRSIGMCAQYVYSKARRHVYIIWSDDDNNHPDTVVKNASFVDGALLKNFINITPPKI